RARAAPREVRKRALEQPIRRRQRVGWRRLTRRRRHHGRRRLLRRRRPRPLGTIPALATLATGTTILATRTTLLGAGRRDRRGRRGGNGLRGWFRVDRRRRNLELAVLQLLQHQPVARGRVRQELAELAVTQLPLVEVRVQVEHHLLQPVRAHDLVVAGHVPDRTLHENPRVLARQVLLVARTRQPRQRGVRVILIAVLYEQVRG